MASRAIAVTLGAAVSPDGEWAASAGGQKDPVVAAAAVADSTALAAAMAVLVADGASPTQAHVTTANNALTTYLAAVVTYQTAVQASVAGNLVLIVDTAVLTTSNKIKGAVKAALQLLRNYGLFTD